MNASVTQREVADATRDAAVKQLAEFLRTMDLSQIATVEVFALNLKVGGVHPLFFIQIAAALEGREVG